VVVCLAMGMASCGTSGSSSSTSGALAPGTYQVTVTATPSVNTSMTQSLVFSLTVNKQ
jgi:hypothetical protein